MKVMLRLLTKIDARFNLFYEVKMFRMNHRIVAGLVLLTLASTAVGQAFMGPCVNVRPFSYHNNVVCQKKMLGGGCECWGTEVVYPPIYNCQNNNSNACPLWLQNDHIVYNQIPGGVNPCGSQHPKYKICLGINCVRDFTSGWSSALMLQTCQ
jgi:hypothetical protein